MLLDEAMSNMRTFFDNAAQRTTDTLQNSKSYMDRAKLRSKLNDAYRALGKAEYEAAIVGVENMNDIHALITEISGLRQSLDEIERNLHKSTPVASAPPKAPQAAPQQAAPAGAVTYCSKCGKQNPADSAFCNGCGSQLVH
ncbi:MAG: zinc ribbon domain-containing protein [Oscillospiraceae bacterium]|nr:zinc ribbon domain-containing protein [Oscillospiraceae bacterium]